MINAVVRGFSWNCLRRSRFCWTHAGAKNDRNAALATGNIISISFIAAIITAAILFFGGRGIISLMRVPAEAVEESWNYLLVCTCGLIFVMGYNVVSSVLRSLGDSKAPFFFILISSLLNVILDYVCVGAFQLAARGAALATVTSQG
jgi:Na+-driven multidrug efflux pump